MPWSINHLKHTLMALVGPTQPSASEVERRVEALRAHILSEMGEYGELHYPRVMRRVRYVQDAQSLWYSRGEMMTVLSAQYGEALASEKMQKISLRFKGLLPRSLGSRPSPLTPLN